MASALDMPLDDLIKANKETGRGRGVRGGRMKVGEGFRRTGGYVDAFHDSTALGPIRRDPFPPIFRPSPYMLAKRDSDGPWKHDLFEAEESSRHHNVLTAGITTGTKVLISNLDYGVSDADIKELFSEVGDVKWSSVRYDRSGRSEGSAEVLYSRRADAETAVKRYHDVLLDGKPMKVQIKGTNLPIPIPPGESLYASALLGGRERRVPGMMFQATGGMPQPRQVIRPGDLFHQSEGASKGLGKEELEKKMRSELDADLERYRAEAKKSS